MMPDGMVVCDYVSEHSRAHRRLVEYGQVLCQQAKGDEPNMRDDRETVRKWVPTAIQEARAWEIQQLLMPPFPARERIVVNVWYKAREADYWHELKPEKQAELETDMCREINFTMRRYCAEVRQLPITIRGYQLRGIRESAVRLLVSLGL